MAARSLVVPRQRIRVARPNLRSTLSMAERFAAMPPRQRAAEVARMSEEEVAGLEWDWKFWARPKQLPPAGDWLVWLIRAGRGFGKTRTGSGWSHNRAMDRPRWIALIAKNPADARDYMVEGPAGFLRTSHPDERPHYEPSKRRLTWKNGTWATIYSDEEPDQLRGFSGDTAWIDEFGKFAHPRECWENLQFGMREVSEDQPRILITTTPRPIAVLREIEKQSGTITVTGTSYENRSNLDPKWYERTIAPYEGTRIGRQEIRAEYLDDVAGALWTRELVERACRNVVVPDLVRIVVAVDPPGKKSGPKKGAEDESAPTADEDNSSALAGIVAAGIGVDGVCYILEDASGRYTPAEWANRAIACYDYWKADRIIGEGNYGGEMVRHTIQSVRQIPVGLVHASRGKQARAEPVSSMYGLGRVKHVKRFPELEDQMCLWEPLTGQSSPDRLDAMVWAVTELMLKDFEGRNILEFYKAAAGKIEKQVATGVVQPPQFGFTVANTDKQVEEQTVRLTVPPGISQVYGITGRAYLVQGDGTVVVSLTDAKPLIGRGYEKVMAEKQEIK